MSIKGLQKRWDKLGEIDPLWAILPDPTKKGNRWQVDKFFETGVKEISNVMQRIKSLGIKVLYGKALDFGCGAGRLTQGLATYFNEVYGIDIASSMIELAKKYNRYGKKCHFYVNDKDDLSFLPANSFDFVYSNIVLSHIKPRYSKKYIKEFLRILVPEGFLVFQLLGPEELRSFKRLKSWIKSILPEIILDSYHSIKSQIRKQPSIEIYQTPKEEIIDFLKNHGAEVEDILQAKTDEGTSFVYYVKKRKITKDNGARIIF